MDNGAVIKLDILIRRQFEIAEENGSPRPHYAAESEWLRECLWMWKWYIVNYEGHLEGLK